MQSNNSVMGSSQIQPLGGRRKFAVISADAGYVAFGTFPVGLFATYLAGGQVLPPAARFTLLAMPILGVIATILTYSFGNRDSPLLVLSVVTLPMALLLLPAVALFHHILELWFIEYSVVLYLISCAGFAIAWFIWRRRAAMRRLCAPPEHLPWT